MTPQYDDPTKNQESYPDPTAYNALRNIDADKRGKLFLDGIWSLCDIYGIRIVGRITFQDKDTGKTWR